MADIEAKRDEQDKKIASLTSDNEAMQSTSGGASNLTPEQYLEQMSEENDLSKLLHYCQLVNAKYMQMMSQQYLEQLSKGGAPQAMPGMPGMPGMAQPGMSAP